MKAHLDVVGLIDLVTGVFFTILAVFVSLGVLLFPRGSTAHRCGSRKTRSPSLWSCQRSAQYCL